MTEEQQPMKTSEPETPVVAVEEPKEEPKVEVPVVVAAESGDTATTAEEKPAKSKSSSKKLKLPKVTFSSLHGV